MTRVDAVGGPAPRGFGHDCDLSDPQDRQFCQVGCRPRRRMTPADAPPPCHGRVRRPAGHGQPGKQHQSTDSHSIAQHEHTRVSSRMPMRRTALTGVVRAGMRSGRDRLHRDGTVDAIEAASSGSGHSGMHRRETAQQHEQTQHPDKPGNSTPRVRCIHRAIICPSTPVPELRPGGIATSWRRRARYRSAHAFSARPREPRKSLPGKRSRAQRPSTH